MVLFPLALAVDPTLVVSTLNWFFSDISRTDTTLYTLVSALAPENSTEVYDPSMVLVLNNTFKGISLHCFEVNSSSPYPNILNHTVPTSYLEPGGVDSITKALLSFLNLSEISVPDFQVYKQEITELNISLYSAEVLVNETSYKVDEVVVGNFTDYYVSSVKRVEVSRYIVGAYSRVKSILASMLLGVIVTFVGLCIFFKRNQRLPFTAKEEARSSFNMESVKNSS